MSNMFSFNSVNEFLLHAAVPFGMLVIFGAGCALYWGFNRHIGRAEASGRKPTAQDQKDLTQFFLTVLTGIIATIITIVVFNTIVATLVAIFVAVIAGGRLNPDAFGLYGPDELLLTEDMREL